MNVSSVLELLRHKMGLNPESIGTAPLEKAVQEHIKRSGAVDIDDYIKRLSDSPEELKSLFELVIIAETSFFRDKVPFITLQKYLERFTSKKKSGRQVRILSVPCSTGEEPYSIAMTLFEMKLPEDRFFIYAVDISERALQCARNGIYSPYSFRGDDLHFKNKYFSKHDDLYILKKEVRDAVHFEFANILDDDFLKGHRPYDIIFCRNLLIYFDDSTKNMAIKSLSKHLSEDGVLFVGHAEAAKMSQSGFVSLDYPMAFAFAREEYAKKINDSLNQDNIDTMIPPLPVQLPTQSIQVKKVNDVRKATGSIIKPKNNYETVEAVNLCQDEKELTRAKNLAEEGNFSEVVSICELLISRGAESAQLYYLLGQAIDSIGDSLMAEEYLKKAIYLNPDFYEALVHLSRIFERTGNPEKGAGFRARAERVKLRSRGGSA
ncbi:MAG: CheR family methyltransferase [Deltaproteobacteria bacterium]